MFVFLFVFGFLFVFLALSLSESLHCVFCNNARNFSPFECNLNANQPLRSISANPIPKETNLVVATAQIQERDANILQGCEFVCLGLNYSEEVLRDYSGAA